MAGVDECNNLVSALDGYAGSLQPEYLCISIGEIEEQLNFNGKTKERLDSCYQRVRDISTCSICQKTDIEDTNIHFVWSLVTAKLAFRLDKVEILCPECSTIADVRKFTQALALEKDSKVFNSIVDHFNSVNGHPLSTSQLQKISLAQEVCAIAFALRTLTKGCRGRFLNQDLSALTSVSVVETIEAQLPSIKGTSGATAKTKKSKSAASTPNNKSSKRAANTGKSHSKKHRKSIA